MLLSSQPVDEFILHLAFILKSYNRIYDSLQAFCQDGLNLRSNYQDLQELTYHAFKLPYWAVLVR